MSITSLSFLIFFGISLGIYYLVPKKFQWMALLVFSLIFFHLSCADYTIIYVAASVLAANFCGRGISKSIEEGNSRRARIFLGIGLGVNILILAVLKYSDFFISNANIAVKLLGGSPLPRLDLLAPIGISFYTMQVMGYLLDTYWGICPAEPNIFKTALFVGYYPQLTSGPIARFAEVREELFSPHQFDSRQIVFGMQRMLWGIFKKLVISARIAVIVDTIYADTLTYDGFYIWVAAALFMFQLYTDFSGCMDIILGASECYGIKLPENFRTPFFSRSVQEYWQRWHITLGAWMRDYVLYPVLRSKAWKNFTKRVKNRFGKRAARQIPTVLGMLIVWILIGLWHGGGWKYIIGEGMWFWACITLAQLLEPVFKKITGKLKINTDCFSFRLFQSLRVFVLVAVGNIFFRLGSFKEALMTIKRGIFPNNPEIFFDRSLFNLGLDVPNFWVMIIGLLILLLISAIQEKCGSVREQIAKQNLVFRWTLWCGLIFGILIFGMYGPGYAAADFIYRGF